MSDFFNVLLTQEFIEKDMKTIRLCGIDSNVFCKIHELLNTGKVNLNYEDAFEVYTACRYLLVKDILLESMQRFILQNLDHLEVFDVYEYCVVNGDPMLDEVRGYIAPQIESLYQTEPFKALPIEAILDLITDSRIKIREEDSLCWIIATRLAHSDERPLKSPFFKPDEPLYVSNEDGLLLVTHFDGSEWSILNGPRKPLHPCTGVEAVARLQTDLFVATSVLKESPFQLESNVVRYNFYSNKMIEMGQPALGEMKGLFLVNGKAFSSTKDIVQQYCAEPGLWLNPIDIGLSRNQFRVSDFQCIFVGGHYVAVDAILFISMTKSARYQGTCGMFIDSDLFVVALGDSPKAWRILKLDVRNVEWETIVNHSSRTSATPVSIRRCREQLVVMDHYHDIHTVPVKGGNLRLFEHYRFALKPVYSVD
ncbi:Kelch-like member 35 [Sarracenia purpurea var. burkii]